MEKDENAIENLLKFASRFEKKVQNVLKQDNSFSKVSLVLTETERFVKSLHSINNYLKNFNDLKRLLNWIKKSNAHIKKLIRISQFTKDFLGIKYLKLKKDVVFQSTPKA